MQGRLAKESTRCLLGRSGIAVRASGHDHFPIHDDFPRGFTGIPICHNHDGKFTLVLGALRDGFVGQQSQWPSKKGPTGSTLEMRWGSWRLVSMGFLGGFLACVRPRGRAKIGNHSWRLLEPPTGCIDEPTKTDPSDVFLAHGTRSTPPLRARTKRNRRARRFRPFPLCHRRCGDWDDGVVRRYSVSVEPLTRVISSTRWPAPA